VKYLLMIYGNQEKWESGRHGERIAAMFDQLLAVT
jgi:hypothetical protein